MDLEAAVATPWGEASKLRDRRLFPGSGNSPEAVARNQRERLFAAAVATVCAKGFETMTVADVLSLSGVSRSAFYRHFADKGDCLTAAVCELVDPTLRSLDLVGERDGEWDPSAALAKFLRLLDSQPAAACACLVEVHAAGAAGEATADWAFTSVAEAI